MKKTSASKMISQQGDELHPEYDFDYRKAGPNRFASRFNKNCRIVVLDPDVSKVFTTMESVNSILRALITAMPKATKSKSAHK